MKTSTKQTFRFFVRAALKYKVLVFVSLFLLVAASVLGVIVPLFIAQFFDVISGTIVVPEGRIVEELTTIIFIILGLELIHWVCYRVAEFSAISYAARGMADISRTCFDSIHKHSYRFFSNNFVGSLVKKVNRIVRAFEDFTDEILWDLTPLIVQTVGIFIVLTLRNSLLGVILSVWIVLFLIINYKFSRYKLKHDIARSKSDSRVTAQLADSITNSTTVKLFSGFGREKKAFRDLTEEQRRLSERTWKLSATMDAVQALLMIALEFGLLYVSIRFWREGILTTGDLVLIQIYLVQLFRKLWDFGRILRRVYEAFADAEEMTEIFNTPHEVVDSVRAKKLKVTRGKIEFKKLRFGYAKGMNLFPEMNLTITPGEKIAFVGQSGSGKSTLVKLLFRFFDPKKGGVLIDGQNIKQVTQESLRSEVSLVPQDPILFHRSLMENIRYGRPEATDEEVYEAGKLAHADEFIENFPDGFETLVGERGVKLSGGERQRVAIARAILKDAPILVLDEATSSLDSHSERMIQDALKTLMKGKTVIVIAHRLSTIMQMDRIVVIRGGRIVDEGTHDELVKRKGGLYERLWKLQAKGFVHA